MKRKFKCILLIAISMILLLGYFQLVKPIKIVNIEVQCVIWDAVYPYISSFADNYVSGDYDKNTTFIHSWNGILPSEDSDDYMDICWYINLKNRCFYENILTDAYITDITSHGDAVLISNSASNTVINYVDKLSENQIMVSAVAYIKDLNKDQIKELVEGMTLEIWFSGNLIGTRTETIKYKSGDKLEIDIEKE